MEREAVRKFREDLKTASPDERAHKRARYGAWLKAGAKAHGLVGHGGFMLLAVCAFCILLAAIRGFETLPIYAALAAGGAIGVTGAWVGARRERKWRRANPFKL